MKEAEFWIISTKATADFKRATQEGADYAHVTMFQCSHLDQDEVFQTSTKASAEFLLNMIEYCVSRGSPWRNCIHDGTFVPKH